MSKTILSIGILLFCLLLPELLLGQSMEGWVKTEGTIKEITTHRGGRKKSVSATVTYTMQDGKTYDGYTQLMPLPILGTTKKEGDKINILYNPKQPGAIHTGTTSFLEQYGLYLMIALGLIFSLGTIKKVMKGQQTEST